MMRIKITESSLKYNNLIYIKSAFGGLLERMNGKESLNNFKNRCEYNLNVPDEYAEILDMELRDKMADIIAVNYKHIFFKKHVKISGLSKIDKELLLTALIAADIDEDKKYIIKKLSNYEEYTLDGLFNFRMKPLKEKWHEITTYIPPAFTKTQLKDFIGYLIKDKGGKIVYVEGDKVYDKRFNLLQRHKLLSEDSLKFSLLKEILLSSAGEVELCSRTSEKEEKYLKEFYGNRLRFNQSYY